MKKYVFLTSILFSFSIFAQNLTLPKANLTTNITLKEALKNRHSCHEFINKEIDTQTLSNLLWVAYGLNRPTKNTIPTAKNEKDLSIYVFNHSGVWLYNPNLHVLKEITNKNHLSLFQTQDYMQNVPLVFVYVGQSDYAFMHAGSAYQNIGLYTATGNLGSIVRGFFKKEQVEKVLHLKKPQQVIVSQAIGYTK